MSITAAKVLSHEVIQAPGTVFKRKRPLVTFSVVTGGAAKQEERLPAMSPLEYYDVLKALIHNGRLEHKHASVIAFELPPLEGQTLQDDASFEMKEALLRPDRVVVMDRTYFTDADEARDVMQKIFHLYGQALTSKAMCDALNSGQLVSCIVSAIGIWTVEAKRFFSAQTKGAGYKGDFVPTGEPNIYKSVPGTGRVVTGYIGEDRSMIVPYSGGFDIRKGAGVATYFDKIPQIIAALAAIEAEGVSEESIIKHLCNRDPQTGEITSKIDVYGMFLNFRQNNYVGFYEGDDLSEDGVKAVEALYAAGNMGPLLPAVRKRGIFQLRRTV